MSRSFADAFAASYARRQPLLREPSLTAYRVFDGSGDGVAGVYVDRFGPATVMSVYEDAGWSDAAIGAAAHAIVERGREDGIAAVYVKRFVKDRSRLAGAVPAEATSATPRAGVEQPEALMVNEYESRFEVRPYDGLSTGLFLEHREHRRWLARQGVKRALNLFAYTGGFSVPLARAGADVTNVDVSARYLDWAARNHELNGIDSAAVRFRRMDAMAFLDYASRHEHERFDLIVLDPPTFGAGNARRKVRTWKALSDYPKLLAASARVLSPGGMIFAATNTRELASGQRLQELIEDALGRVRWKALPDWPIDVRERGRVAAALFTLDAPAPLRPQPHRSATRTTAGVRRRPARARR